MLKVSNHAKIDDMLNTSTESTELFTLNKNSIAYLAKIVISYYSKSDIRITRYGLMILKNGIKDAKAKLSTFFVLK